MALWFWRWLKHGRPSHRKNNNRLNRYSISMQNLSERKFNHFKWWDTRVQERSQNNGCKKMDFDNNRAGLSEKYRNECDSYGWVNRKTFEGYVKDVVLKARTKDGKVVSKDGLQLPGPLEELGCDTTSFYPYAYTWDAPDNCALAICRKEGVNMIKQGKKTTILSVDETTPVSIYSRWKWNPKSFATNQYKYARPTTIHYTWLSTLVDSTWLPEREWDSQEEHNIYKFTNLKFHLTAGYSYTNLSHPIQITLTQKHLTTWTQIKNSIKEPNWFFYFSKAQRCLKAPRYNF